MRRPDSIPPPTRFPHGAKPAPAANPPATVAAPTGSRYLRPQDLKRLENFHFAAKMVVEGFYSGRHRSPFHDLSAEFADYRPYTPGDEIRSLDWRAYARTDRDYIKLFRKETEMRCHVLVDTSRSMAYRAGDLAPAKPARKWWQSRPRRGQTRPFPSCRRRYPSSSTAPIWLRPSAI